MHTNGTTKMARIAAVTSFAAALLAMPTLAMAGFHHHGHRGDASARGVQQIAGQDAPEIDPGTLRGMAALVVGGLAIFGARRRLRP